MKVLYFGTVCDLDNYYKFLEGSKYMPTVATIVFESALLQGLYENNVEVEVHSYPMIPTFPSSKHLYFGKQTEILSCGFSSRWLNTINLPIIKQISRRIDATKILRRWIKENSGDGVILTYSIPPFLIKNILKYAKKYSVKVIPVVTDLLRDMYVNESKSFLKSLKDFYLKTPLKLQGECDGYVYLTEAMAKEVAPDKPYIVMEGIANEKSVPLKNIEKPSVKAVMYAGALYEKYGILNLVKAFIQVENKDAELWLFGDGTAVPEIEKFAEIDTRIKYFGSLSRESILDYERKATLLVNPRDPNEEFTKFSFPSKTIEYMLSETPLLTTKLQGIPTEYYDYVFSADDNGVESLANAISNALSHSDDELNEIGVRARNFIIKNKNAKYQVSRIIDFINNLN